MPQQNQWGEQVYGRRPTNEELGVPLSIEQIASASYPQILREMRRGLDQPQFIVTNRETYELYQSLLNEDSPYPYSYDDVYEEPSPNIFEELHQDV